MDAAARSFTDEHPSAVTARWEPLFARAVLFALEQKQLTRNSSP